MNDTKRRIEIFSFFNQNGIRDHLEKMAQKGWMIEKLTNFGWIYRPIEPKKIRFAVSYYPKASEFDPEPSEEQKTFHDFCAHTGWELACASAQLQIFYNERENPTPIETEPKLELEAIHASAKKSFLPAYFVLLGISILQGVMFVSGLLGDPIGLLANPTRLFAGFCFPLCMALCLVELACYFGWYSRARKAAAMGAFLNPPDTSNAQKAVLIALIISGGYYLVNTLFSGDPLRRWLVFLMCLIYPLVYMLVNGVKEYLKRRKASKEINRAVTIASSFILTFVLMGLITFGTLRLSQNGFFASADEETYTHRGMTWVIHHDELPLTIEDLTDVEFDGYTRQQSGDESLLLGKLDFQQRPRYDADDFARIPTLEYTMIVVKLPFLYDLCKNQLLEKPGNTHETMVQTYQRVPAEPWGCSDAYQLNDPEYGPRSTYLLCYDHVIVEIQFDWEPTNEQKEIVGQKLGV